MFLFPVSHSFLTQSSTFKSVLLDLGFTMREILIFAAARSLACRGQTRDGNQKLGSVFGNVELTYISLFLAPTALPTR
jgi:hypothetical protein